MAKVIFSLPEELLEKVDEYCRTHNYNRSEFIRFVMRKEIKNGNIQEK